jgi:hypothetical protein
VLGGTIHSNQTPSKTVYFILNVELNAEVDHDVPTDFADFFVMHAKIRDNNVHEQIQHDLVEHLSRVKELSVNTAAP